MRRSRARTRNKCSARPSHVTQPGRALFRRARPRLQCHRARLIRDTGRGHRPPERLSKSIASVRKPYRPVPTADAASPRVSDAVSEPTDRLASLQPRRVAVVRFHSSPAPAPTKIRHHFNGLHGGASLASLSLEAARQHLRRSERRVNLTIEREHLDALVAHRRGDRLTLHRSHPLSSPRPRGPRPHLARHGRTVRPSD